MPEDPINKNSSKDEDNICSSNYTIDENNKRVLEFIEDVTCNAAEVQKRVLNEILSQNSGVEYLQRHGLSCLYGKNTTCDHDDHHHDEEFKKMIPVVKYEDLKPDIDRIANGDTSHILCSKPISEFLTSSGTSAGERKLMPTIEEDLERRSFLYSLLMPVMDKFIPNLDKGKGMYFLFIKSESRTPGGLPARPVLTSYYKSSHFRHRQSYNNYTSPYETILCPDSYQSMYSQLLCGLSQRDQVLRVGAVFASGFIRAIRFLQNHWPILCKDIRTGTVDSQIITDCSVRNAVMKILERPNPKLADVIQEECKKDSWKGIIPRLWPKTKYIDVIVTGTMSQYIPTLNYYGNDNLPLVSTMYASSECYFGINLNPLSKPSEVTYTLIPTMAYFEFLPLSSSSSEHDEHRELIDLVDVEIGQEYELVITTYAGLYRYRVGDILRVVKFKNNAPEFSFVCRKNVALSIDSDKTDEVELHNAVTEAANRYVLPLNANLVEYTSYADTSTIPGHYVLYWEISLSMDQIIPASIFEDCCLTIEESLNTVYRQCRVSDKSIGPLEIKIVENGTFDKLMDFAISNGASINQYKAPRCVNYAPILDLLNSRVVSSYFSPKCPRWSPVGSS